MLRKLEIAYLAVLAVFTVHNPNPESCNAVKNLQMAEIYQFLTDHKIYSVFFRYSHGT